MTKWSIDTHLARPVRTRVPRRVLRQCHRYCYDSEEEEGGVVDRGRGGDSTVRSVVVVVDDDYHRPTAIHQSSLPILAVLATNSHPTVARSRPVAIVALGPCRRCRNVRPVRIESSSPAKCPVEHATIWSHSERGPSSYSNDYYYYYYW